MAQVKLLTFRLSGDTNDIGLFSIQHDLNAQIRGILVAAQHTNGNWHTLEFSNSVDNRFWWNDTQIQGQIDSPHFFNRSVRVIAFAESIAE